VCTVMEEYQKDAVDKAIRETWGKAAAVVTEEVNRKSFATVAENLRKQNPSLSAAEAREQARELLGFEN
jgi:hypothetical protein